MSELLEYLEFSKAIARSAGEILCEVRSSGQLSVENKAPRDLVTRGDLMAERMLVAAITERFADHKILSEEAGFDQASILNSRYLWVIDPIDGTTNFARGQLMSAVSIALAIDGVVEVGVVHAPFIGETFWAIRGRGSFLNGAALKVSAVTELIDALVAIGFPYERGPELAIIMQRVGRLVAVCSDLRRLGAASLDLCWLAAGRLDAYWEADLKPWDIAAGALIVREAGGLVGSLDVVPLGYPRDLFGRNLVAGNPGVYQKVFDILT